MFYREVVQETRKKVFTLELFGLLLALVAIILITSKWHEVIYALLLGIAIIIIFSAMSIDTVISTFMAAATNLNTISLTIIVLLITLFSSVMYKTLLLDKLIKSLIVSLKNIHMLVAAIPALIGLLAVPGGSIMSAPFVDQIGDRISMSNAYKSAINNFYRHVLLFFNPMAPALIVMADLSTLGFIPIMKFHLIPVIITIIVAHIVLKRLYPHIIHESNISSSQKEEPTNMSFATSLKNIFIAGFPFIAAIILALVFEVNFIIALIMAIAFTIILDYKGNKVLKTSDIKPLFIKGINWKLGLSVFTIMLFGEFIKASGTIPIMAQIITDSNMSLLLILLISSVIVGFASGHPIIGAAILYPIFIPIVGESAAYLSLIFTGMMLGYVVSPVHLCLVVSNEYFKTNYLKSNKLLLPLQVLLTALAVLMAILIY